MVPRLCAVVIAIAVSSPLQVIAQPTLVPPPVSGTPGAQGAQIPSSNQPKPAQHENPSAGEVTVLKPPKPAQDQKSGGDRAQAQNGVGAVEHKPSETDERLANLTFWLVLATIGLMVATVFLWLETRRMATQAVEASKDAKKSIEIATRAANASATSADATVRAAEAAMRQAEADRPWILFDRIECGPANNIIFPDGRRENGVGLIVHFKNAGRMPAIINQMTIGHCTEGNDTSEPDFAGNTKILTINHILGPADSMGTAPLIFWGKDAAGIINGEKIICVFAEFSYKSVVTDKDLKSTYCIGVFRQNGEITDDTGRQRSYSSKLIGKRNVIV